jgi:hypothetical protein
MRLGKTWNQAIALWKLAKSGKLGKKGKIRTVTKTIVRRIKSKPKIKYRTRTIASEPKIRYRTRTKTVVKKIASKPKIKYRVRTKTIVKKIRSKPVRRTVTRVVQASPGYDVNELCSVVESSLASHSLSKRDLKDALNPDAEEIAFKIIQTYFMEVARLGFKRQLSLDEIINAYFYALARVKRQNIESAEVEQAVKDSGMKK